MPGPPGWVLSHGLMFHPHKKNIISETRHSFQDSRLRIVEALCITECEEVRQVGEAGGVLKISKECLTLNKYFLPRSAFTSNSNLSFALRLPSTKLDFGPRSI